jgi:hypothetical protein
MSAAWLGAAAFRFHGSACGTTGLMNFLGNRSVGLVDE